MGDMILDRRVPDEAIELIKHWEGFNANPYLAPCRVWSIGYGHTRSVRAGMQVTEEQAAELLQDDMRRVERLVQRVVTVPLNDSQFGALCAFCFNVGTLNFENSTLLKLLNRGWYDQVPVQLIRWDRAHGEKMGGLARRRAAEAKLWNSWTSREEVA